MCWVCRVPCGVVVWWCRLTSFALGGWLYLFCSFLFSLGGGVRCGVLLYLFFSIPLFRFAGCAGAPLAVPLCALLHRCAAGVLGGGRHTSFSLPL